MLQPSSSAVLRTSFAFWTSLHAFMNWSEVEKAKDVQIVEFRVLIDILTLDDCGAGEGMSFNYKYSENLQDSNYSIKHQEITFSSFNKVIGEAALFKIHLLKYTFRAENSKAGTMLLLTCSSFQIANID